MGRTPGHPVVMFGGGHLMATVGTGVRTAHGVSPTPRRSIFTDTTFTDTTR